MGDRTAPTIQMSPHSANQVRRFFLRNSSQLLTTANLLACPNGFAMRCVTMSGNEECINEKFVCDGIDHCKNQEDELNCGKIRFPTFNLACLVDFTLYTEVHFFKSVEYLNF